MVILFYPTLTGWRNALPKESPKRNVQKEKIETDKRRKHFFHTFLYLPDEGTNQRYVPRRSVVPKTPYRKIVVVGSASLPEKEIGSQKTWVFISLYRLQIHHYKILQILARPLPIGYFTFYYFSFFFWFLTGWMCGALCVVTRLYILYVAADESFLNPHKHSLLRHLRCQVTNSALLSRYCLG